MRTCRSRARLLPSNVTTSAPPESTAQSASVSPSVPTPWNPMIALFGVEPATEMTGHITAGSAGLGFAICEASWQFFVSPVAASKRVKSCASRVFAKTASPAAT